MHMTLRCTLRYAYSTGVGPPPKYPIFIQKTTVIGGFLVGIAYTILKYPEGQGEIKLNLALLQFYNTCIIFASPTVRHIHTESLASNLVD